MVYNLGVSFDLELAFEVHVGQIVTAPYYYLINVFRQRHAINYSIEMQTFSYRLCEILLILL